MSTPVLAFTVVTTLAFASPFVILAADAILRMHARIRRSR